MEPSDRLGIKISGGDFGDLYERAPKSATENVFNELVSKESARKDCGIIVNPDTLELDQKATEALRAEGLVSYE